MPREELHNLFRHGESPYIAMYRAGRTGYTIDVVTDYCARIGVPLRRKDIENFNRGVFQLQLHDMSSPNNIASGLGISLPKSQAYESKLEDFPTYPNSWIGCEHRFFPCTSDNKPMVQWGWKPGFTPQLYKYADAKAMSPVNWVGQNMLGQRFIVLDIDGVGHGCTDNSVIQFGSLFKDMTMVMEDPAKVGSFHLYFKTDRIIPVKHFPHAKIDVMGNAVNAAVYLKSKVSNGKPMAELTSEIWNALMAYQKKRKESWYGIEPNIIQP